MIKRAYTMLGDLNQEQREIIRKKAARGTLVEDRVLEAMEDGRLAVGFLHQGREFTLAYLFEYDERHREATLENAFMGMAKKHDVDEFDESVGRRIAFTRAIDEGKHMWDISFGTSF